MDKYGRPTTLEEIKMLDKESLIPADVCGFLRCSQYAINVQARDNPHKLGFPVTVMSSRVHIPKAGFVAWAEGRNVDAIIAAVEMRLAEIYST